MEKLVVPQIVPLNYRGQAVLTTNQIGEIFDCPPSSIRGYFRYYNNDFVEGEDYFKLKGGELRQLKEDARKFIAVSEKNFTAVSERNFTALKKILSQMGSNLNLWTKSGALKFSKIIDTDRAKLIYTSLKFGQFVPYSTIPLQPPAPSNVLPKNSTAFETYAELKFLIANCTDENLRDELIKTAANILIQKNIP